MKNYNFIRVLLKIVLHFKLILSVFCSSEWHRTAPAASERVCVDTAEISDLCEDTEEDRDSRHSSSGFLLHPAAWLFLLSCEMSWIPLSIRVTKQLTSRTFIYTLMALMSRSECANRIWTWIKNSFNSSSSTFLAPFFPTAPVERVFPEAMRSHTKNTHSVKKFSKKKCEKFEKSVI